MSQLITVSANGVDVKNAKGSDVLFSTAFPFAKLDTTNTVSFQIISIFFNNDPPSPAFGNAPIKTQVYQFKHGYTYVPSTWFLLQFDSASRQTPGYQYENGIIQVSSVADNANYAEFDVSIDQTNVTFYITKNTINNIDPLSEIFGYTLNIRSYVFVEDLLGGSVPLHA